MSSAEETVEDVPLAEYPSTADLFTRRNAPIVIAVVGLVTLGAFENRAVMTAMPSVLTELDAVTGYGLVGAAPLATYLISLAAAGWWADRMGPVPVLRAGALTFVAGMLAVAGATALSTLVLGRLLSGLAEGLLDVGVMVLVSRVLDPALRPKVVAMFAAAWVLPSVLGPVVTGTVTEWVGWRWVFLGGPAALVPVWLALRPALTVARLLPRGEPGPDGDTHRLRRVLPRAFLGAAALVALNLIGEQVTTRGVTAGFVVVVALALVALAAAAHRLLPSGSLRAACGLGGVIALRGLLSAAFLGVGAFLPLILTVLRHHGPLTAGLSLSITGVTWSTGSAIQSRLSDHPLGLVRAGFGLVVAGLAGASLIVWIDAPTWLGLGAWALAGVGIGMTSATLSVLTMSASDDTNQGRNNAGGQMAASMASAAFFAVAGGILALAGGPTRLAFGVISVLAVALATMGLAATGRVRCAVPVCASAQRELG